MSVPYDAFLLVSFGGPDRTEDVIPFLENVLRGKNVPRERMLEVAEHYYHFGGASPINAQNRELLAAIKTEFAAAGIDLPIYWGNRNWDPLLTDTLRQMQADGVQRALALFTAAFSSYSGCRQYQENVRQAREEVGPDAPVVEKLRGYFNHPGFIAAMIERTRDAFAKLPSATRGSAKLLFTAHSIPLSMANTCQYVAQLQDAAASIAAGVAHPAWRLVYQSRSGPPSQPWLEPDIGEALRELAAAGDKNVIVVPLGFISDHMEVLYDLDTEALQQANALGLTLVRAGTVGVHPRFVQMIRELVEERLSGTTARPTVGQLGPCPDVCAVDCCRYEPRRPV